MAILLLGLILCAQVVSGSHLTNKVYKWTQNAPTGYISTGKTLEGHWFFQSQKADVALCAYQCLRRNNCLSFNYDTATGECVLNRKSHVNIPLVDAVFSWQYHARDAFAIDQEALGPCAGDVCNNHGRCLETKTTDDDLIAICLCDQGWAGSRCDIADSLPEWGSWGTWEDCSVTCDKGWRIRTRNCEDSDSGQSLEPLECYGRDVEYEACQQQACPRWEAWEEWGPCSTYQTCGRGHKVRNRTCSNGGVPGVDRYCLGVTNESTVCNGINCLGPLRLRGGSAHGEGRVEVFNDVMREWGMICGDQWTLQAAELVCKQLGMPGAHLATQDNQFGSGGLYGVSQLTCHGQERSLQMCERGTWDLQATCPSGSQPAGLRCKVNGVWALWGPWGECSVTCEAGIRQRTRTCSHPPALHGGKDCVGEDMQTKPCTLQMCPVDGEWLPWSDWSKCSKTCANGTQTRERICQGPFHGGRTCMGKKQQTQTCKDRECPVDGVWNGWETWGDCTEICGGGERTRERSCQGPFFEGKPCSGNISETEECNNFNCPVDGSWLPWHDWRDCSVTCGGGRQVRKRDCLQPKHGGNVCGGESVETRDCNAHECPVDAYWLPWGDWGVCNVSCGTGMQMRMRACESGLNGGKDCTGAAEELQACNQHACPVDGLWREWNEWSACSHRCDNGTQTRNRTCDGPYFGGKECAGSGLDLRYCNTHSCAVDGIFTEWSKWSECTLTCGGGSQWRSRNCIGPFDGGKDCDGPRNVSQVCESQHCPIDGVYSEWAVWGSCDVTCGGGTQARTRSCTAPQNGGQDCEGPPVDTKPCNSHHCPVDGAWLDWGNWGPCNTTCGGGYSKRRRDCDPPQYGGADCVGESEELQTCSPNLCPIPGDWFEWEEWSECSVTCGGGTKSRSRECDMTSYGNLTAPCEGPTDENVDCHTFSCRPLVRTCSEWGSRGLTASTMADIDPDGTDGVLSPTQVYCNMSAEGGIGVTVIGHDSEEEEEVVGYEGAGEFVLELTYNVTLDHAIAIIDASENCRQFIRWKCKAALIHNHNGNGEITTGWRNRTGGEADYFGDAPPGSGMCTCGVTNSCADPTLPCNCDMNDEVWREDSGYLTYKPDLPVTEFMAGDTGADRTEAGAATVGRVLCTGVAT